MLARVWGKEKKTVARPTTHVHVDGSNQPVAMALNPFCIAVFRKKVRHQSDLKQTFTSTFVCIESLRWPAAFSATQHLLCAAFMCKTGIYALSSASQK